MDYVDIVNGVINLPHSELSMLEIDIAVLNEFEIETAFGGGTYYFDSSCGDHIELLKAAAARHSFFELLEWFDRVADLSPDLVNVDRDTRAEGLRLLDQRADDSISDDGCQLAEKAGSLWIELVENNMRELKVSNLSRLK